MSLRIGLEVYRILSAARLPGGAAARIYPVLSKTGAVEKPFLTYRSKVSANPTKDGDAYDTNEVAVTCLADTSEEAVELAVAVRHYLTRRPVLGAECTLLDSEDGYALDADAYTYTVRFTARTAPDEWEEG